MIDAYAVTREFEAALCKYSGAKYAVCVNSCSAALLLAVKWHFKDYEREPYYQFDDEFVEIPRRTYVSVPCAIRLAGARVAWRDEDWRGAYQLKPLMVWDCARRFTSGMYVSGQFQAVSFSSSKILGIEQGGGLLHDSDEADAWLRKMRFDGRTEGLNPRDDTFDVIGMHCLMLPSIAAQLLLKLSFLPLQNADLPTYDYPDLSLHPAFK